MVANKLDLQKRQHRERSQPLKRQKLGLLEKHADYVKRARDFHSKEDRIQKLREKASGRNKDEFYFGMIKSKTIKGVHVQSRGNESMPQDLVKVLKTQDAGYIRTQRSIEAGKVKRLEQQINSLLEENAAGSTSAAPIGDDDMDFDMFDDEMMMMDEPSGSASGRNHVIFSDDLEAVRTTSDPTTLLPKRSLLKQAVDAVTLKRNRKGKAKAVEIDAELVRAEEKEREASALAHRAKLTQELSARTTRLDALTRALREIEMQRLLMGNGAKAIIKKKTSKSSSGGDDDFNEGDGGKEDPEHEDGIATGARTWKWKSERKR